MFLLYSQKPVLSPLILVTSLSLCTSEGNFPPQCPTHSVLSSSKISVVITPIALMLSHTHLITQGNYLVGPSCLPLPDELLTAPHLLSTSSPLFLSSPFNQPTLLHLYSSPLPMAVSLPLSVSHPSEWRDAVWLPLVVALDRASIRGNQVCRLPNKEPCVVLTCLPQSNEDIDVEWIEIPIQEQKHCHWQSIPLFNCWFGIPLNVLGWG